MQTAESFLEVGEAEHRERAGAGWSVHKGQTLPLCPWSFKGPSGLTCRPAPGGQAPTTVPLFRAAASPQRPAESCTSAPRGQD